MNDTYWRDLKEMSLSCYKRHKSRRVNKTLLFCGRSDTPSSWRTSLLFHGPQGGVKQNKMYF